MHPIIEEAKQRRVIAIVRGLAPTHMEKLAAALLEGGIQMIEVTFNQSRPETWEETAGAISMLADTFSGSILPGAGTVLSADQVQMAYDSGAKYIISPNVDEAVIEKTKSLGLASLPGAFTPSEIVIAYQMGADAVKVFPVGSVGPDYIKAVRAPLSHIPLMAVGGVTEKNLAAYLKAGAMGVGVGGNIVNKEWIEQGEWGKISALAREYCAAAESVSL